LTALGVVLALLAPSGAAAAEPALGGAVTLADGTVLAPMPADMLTPSAQAEMLAERGGPGLAAGGDDLKSSGVAVAAEPLVAGDGSLAGPAGPLPNGLAKEVLGFLPYWDLDTSVTSRLRLDLLSTVAYFSIGVASDGALIKTTSSGALTQGWAGWTSAAMTDLLNAAHRRGVRVVPTITMHAWDYNYAPMTTLLNSATNRARLVSQVVSMVRDRRADGVNIDFEPVPSSLRGQFTALTAEINTGLANAGVGGYVTVDTMAGAAAWSTGYDVAALSTAADAIVVMAYDFSYAGSARAGGVAPYESPYIYAAADAMRDHLARVNPARMIWGVPYYGRAWNTTTDAVNSTVRSPASSVSVAYYRSDSSGANARTLAQTNGRRWDATGQVPYTVYRAPDGGWRQLYYDDATSIGLKYDMILRNDVAGTGIWALGMDTGTSDLWDVIEGRLLEGLGRVYGADRYATAAAVSASAYGPGVPVVYVATGASFPDALAAGPPAGRGGGPVLLTWRDQLPGSTRAELERLQPSRIVVLGGTGAVADSVLTTLRGLATSGSVTRIAGADRYATAAAASAATFAPGTPVAYVATGSAFADALAGGAAAGRQGGPILLTLPSSLPAPTAAELGRLKPGRIVVLGGTGAVSASVAAQLDAYTTGSVTRLSGADRYATAVAVSQATTAAGPRVVYVATGTSYPDGLAGTPPAVRDQGPLLLTRSVSLPAAVAAELLRLAPARIVVLGGPGAVSSGVMAQLRQLWD
jgi:spore germination protein YaaH/putative cell wall-binding protein